MLPLVRHLKSSALLISASGLREGLLFEDLPDDVRLQDPLIAGAAAEGARFARFAGHGTAIDKWISPLFAHDTPIDRRLRLAACLLADNALSANPDYRPQRAIDMALHGQWSGIDLADRIILAQMLYAASGGSGRAVVPTPALDLNDRLNRATLVGLAIRLAQRLSGGAPGPLLQTELAKTDSAVTLTFARGAETLAGEQVSKRLRQLANALGLSAEERVQPQRSAVTTPS
jgi:exopolyphosphatase/guanosine-5'-triphosphate,3'-diphosphate pyrophosphatase